MRWTQVMASAHDQSQAGRAALTSLCQINWCQFIPLDLETSENRYRLEPADYLMAEGEIGALCDALIAAEGRLKP
jgi:hypothetical protein